MATVTIDGKELTIEKLEGGNPMGDYSVSEEKVQKDTRYYTIESLEATIVNLQSKIDDTQKLIDELKKLEPVPVPEPIPESEPIPE